MPRQLLEIAYVLAWSVPVTLILYTLIMSRGGRFGQCTGCHRCTVPRKLNRRIHAYCRECMPEIWQ